MKVRTYSLLLFSKRKPEPHKALHSLAKMGYLYPLTVILVLNKYNTNYEALRLAYSTALAFNLGKILLELITTS